MELIGFSRVSMLVLAMIMLGFVALHLLNLKSGIGACRTQPKAIFYSGTLAWPGSWETHKGSLMTQHKTNGGGKNDTIRVLIVDDHVVVRRGLQMLLDTDSSVQIVGEAANSHQAVRQAKSLQPDVILMDLVMPMGDGVEAIAEIKRYSPHIKIIVLTTFGDEPRIQAAMKAGANGYLLKDADGDALLQAIHAATQGDMPLNPHIARHLVNGLTLNDNVPGDKPLTEREKEILRWVAQGLSNKAIAQTLDLSEGTVKVHVSNILRKLNVSSRTEASVRALQTGLISSVEDN
jgi:NarL family two-component system response regulator LiaR